MAPRKQRAKLAQSVSATAVLDDPDLLKIILESGGIAVMRSCDGTLSAPLVCKAWSTVATALAREWCVLKWNHRGSEGKLLEDGSPFSLMGIHASQILSVPSLCKASAAGALMCSGDTLSLVKVSRSLSPVKQHELFHGKVQLSKVLAEDVGGMVVAGPHLHMTLCNTSQIGTMCLADKRLVCRFGGRGAGDGQLRLDAQTGLAHCARRERLFVSDSANNRVAALQTSSSSAELLWLSSTRGEDCGGKSKIPFPTSLAVIGDNIAVISGKQQNKLLIVPLCAGDSFGTPRPLGGNGTALGPIKGGVVTARRDRLFLANGSSIHVLSSEGVLWQTISVSVRNGPAVPRCITVDDKRAYVLFWGGVYIVDAHESLIGSGSSSH